MYTEETLIFYVLIGSILIVAIVIWYFQFSMKRQYTGYLQLQKQYERIKIETQETERQAIAADLHDEVGPILSATNFRLGEIKPDSDWGRQLLGEARDHLKQVHLRLKRMSSMLVPRTLHTNGPLYAIQEFLMQYMGPVPLEVEVKTVDLQELPAEKSLHLFRMLQEILHNAIKHSKAKRLVITAEKHPDRLVIQTSDDGIGFNPTITGEQKGLGLHYLATRAELIGAMLVTETAAGRGTKYRITVRF